MDLGAGDVAHKAMIQKWYNWIRISDTFLWLELRILQIVTIYIL
jgi:hypothetical protein